MSASGYRTVMVQGCDEGLLEYLAGETAIKPGHLLNISSGAVIKHATADGFTARIFAVESQTADSPTLASIDVPYANGDTVYAVQCEPGDVVYAWLATANNAVKGVSVLVSNGDGTLKIATLGAGTFAGAIVGVPDENLNNTSGSASRLAVRIA